jgi:hypothetical protein
MADIGKSQSRMVQNLGNSPAGQTGYPTGSRGNAYYKAGSIPDAQGRIAKTTSLNSATTPAGSGTTSTYAGTGQHYAELGAKQDSSLHRVGHSTSLFGGQLGSGGTQADAGTLPIPTGGSSVTIYYLMRARDPDCVSQPTYVYWVVTGAPDPTAAQYAGSRCGVHALVDIVVDATW